MECSVADQTSRTPPQQLPGRPDDGTAPAVAWNMPTQPLRPQARRTGERWPYAVFAAVTLLIAGLATAVVLLAR
ncbi:hypothetical protein D7193_26260 [Micromonospora costi]|uniref:Uncharacterized protein n=1 Tax=Micromonospora costi TaxID=1530042 RepID=A0A3A9ZW33_9ACTN|nr:hypothetical protein D7193_26260 [Micromonospora costi]